MRKTSARDGLKLAARALRAAWLGHALLLAALVLGLTAAPGHAAPGAGMAAGRDMAVQPQTDLLGAGGAAPGCCRIAETGAACAEIACAGLALAAPPPILLRARARAGRRAPRHRRQPPGMALTPSIRPPIPVRR